MNRIFFVIILLLSASGMAACNSYTGGAYVVRHADRDPVQDDALLIPQGPERAQALADKLKDVGIVAIFSTNTVRTKATAQPLADTLGLPITTYGSPDADVPDVVAEVTQNYRDEFVLIVGHSPTVATIVQDLGAEVPAALPLVNGNIYLNDYDNLVLVLFDDEGGASAVHMTYGVATPPP